MYTVARFLIDPKHLDELHEIGERMNTVHPGIYRGPRSRLDGMAVDVARGGTWLNHSQSIASFVRKFSEQIQSARALGADVTIDVAAEPEDLVRAPFVLRQEPALMQEIVNTGVALEVSVYAAGSQ